LYFCRQFQDFKIPDFKIIIQNSRIVVIELLTVWVIGVVAFFALWAVLLKVIKWISEKRNPKGESFQEESEEKVISPKTLEQS
jgi:hypothetical protein